MQLLSIFVHSLQQLTADTVSQQILGQYAQAKI